MLHVDARPALRDPVLVVALRGWMDAGDAGVLAATLLAEQLDGGRPFARYDLADLLDLSQTRPRVVLEEGGRRRVIWPVVEITAGRAGRDVIVCVGPEPSLCWPTFTRELTDLFCGLGVSYVCTLAGVPAVVSHRVPTPVLVTASSRAVAREAGAMPYDYVGQTGVQSVLQLALGERGVPGVGLWAQVPHYVAATPAPAAVRALLQRVGELTAVRTDLAGLDEQVDAYTTTIDHGLGDRPDVAELVRAIESESPEEVSGDALAEEIERFLRGRREQ